MRQKRPQRLQIGSTRTPWTGLRRHPTRPQAICPRLPPKPLQPHRHRRRYRGRWWSRAEAMTGPASSGKPRPPQPATGVLASAPVPRAALAQDAREPLARSGRIVVLAGDLMTGARHAPMLRMRHRVWVTRLSAHSGKLWKVRNRRSTAWRCRPTARCWCNCWRRGSNATPRHYLLRRHWGPNRRPASARNGVRYWPADRRRKRRLRARLYCVWRWRPKFLPRLSLWMRAARFSSSC